MFIPSIQLPAQRAILYRLDQPRVKHTVEAFLRGESPFLEPRWIVYVENKFSPQYMFMCRMSAEGARAACENRLAIDPENLVISDEIFDERVPSKMIVQYRPDWAVKQFGLSEKDEDRRRADEVEELVRQEMKYQRGGRRSGRADGARQMTLGFVTAGMVSAEYATAAAGAFRKDILTPSHVPSPPVDDSEGVPF